MKPRLLSMLAFVLILAFSPAIAAEAGKSYPAAEAKSHIGETATVTGTVDGIKVLGSGMVLLNVDGHYPNQALTAVIRESDVAAVGDVSAYDGKKVSVTGTITEYKGGAQIELKTKESIRLAGP